MTWPNLEQQCYGGYIAWSQFVKALYDSFDYESHFLGRLIKLRQIDLVEEFIAIIEELVICTKGLTNSFYIECFIIKLKEEIREQVWM